MAKGNLFLGQASGSIGDITFYTGVKGGQVSRVRRRVIRNPRSANQLVQRAIASTVMQAYKAGREIFDHSFEGYSVPGGCLRRFQSLNMRLLRQQLAQDYANIGTATYETYAAVVPPKATAPVPNSYIVSEGSLTPKWLKTVVTNGQNYVELSSPVLPSGTTDMTVAELIELLGLEVGDIFTIVCFAVPEDYDSAIDEPLGYSAVFRWVRFEVIGDHLAETAVSGGREVSNVFQLIFSKSTNDSSNISTASISQDVFGDRYEGSCFYVKSGLGSILSPVGFIFSKKDSGLRSTCQLTDFNGGNASVSARDLLEVWSDGSQQIDVGSDLILEGGDN